MEVRGNDTGQQTRTHRHATSGLYRSPAVGPTTTITTPTFTYPKRPTHCLGPSHHHHPPPLQPSPPPALN